MKRVVVPVIAAVVVVAIVLAVWRLTQPERPEVPRASSAGAGAGTEARPVPVTGYSAKGHRLRLRYTIGVPACYGRLAEPVVRETATTVTVTLSRVPPERTPYACIEIALLKSVDVRLSSPLRGRQVLDGSTQPPQPVRRTAGGPAAG